MLLMGCIGYACSSGVLFRLSCCRHMPLSPDPQASCMAASFGLSAKLCEKHAMQLMCSLHHLSALEERN